MRHARGGGGGGARRCSAGGAFGDAGRTVVIESFLEGEEISVLAVTDGREVELLPVAQDHKRLLEGDAGPNTGGMGAYSPVSRGHAGAAGAGAARGAAAPTLAEMRRRGAPFTGVLYAGLMVDRDGTPWVVEFNCRLGDPETQVVLPLVAGGLTECLWSVARGRAAAPAPAPGRGRGDDRARRARISRCAGERRGDHHPAASCRTGVTVFHAGTTRDADGVLRANGGRVLNVTAVAPGFAEAQRLSREAADAIGFEGKVCRRDIGWREAARQVGRAHRLLRFPPQCPSCPKSKPSSATSAPPCSAAASSASRSAMTTCSAA